MSNINNNDISVRIKAKLNEIKQIVLEDRLLSHAENLLSENEYKLLVDICEVDLNELLEEDLIGLAEELMGYSFTTIEDFEESYMILLEKMFN